MTPKANQEDLFAKNVKECSLISTRPTFGRTKFRLSIAMLSFSNSMGTSRSWSRGTAMIAVRSIQLGLGRQPRELIAAVLGAARRKCRSNQNDQLRQRKALLHPGQRAVLAGKPARSCRLRTTKGQLHGVERTSKTDMGMRLDGGCFLAVLSQIELTHWEAFMGRAR
jgi:hypothetical protein